VLVLVTEGGEETPSALVTLSDFQRFYTEKTRAGDIARGESTEGTHVAFVVDADKRARPCWTALFGRSVALRSRRDPFAYCTERGGKVKRKVSRRKY